MWINIKIWSYFGCNPVSRRGAKRREGGRHVFVVSAIWMWEQQEIWDRVQITTLRCNSRPIGAPFRGWADTVLQFAFGLISNTLQSDFQLES